MISNPLMSGVAEADENLSELATIGLWRTFSHCFRIHLIYPWGRQKIGIALVTRDVERQ